MNAFLHLPTSDKKIYFEQAGSKLGLPPITIEKDFWVCWTLDALFQIPKWGEAFSFKGGTSLSKVWKLISRFSEDVDIVIDRQFLGCEIDNPTRGDISRLREACESRVEEELLPLLSDQVNNHGQTHLGLAMDDEGPNSPTILLRYPSIYEDGPKYILQRQVRIELGARADFEPFEHMPVVPYVFEALPSIDYAEMNPIRTVLPIRTFWEKVMLLHEHGCLKKDDIPKFKARHYYDVHELIQQGVADAAITADGLFESIAEHRSRWFRYGGVNYESLKQGEISIMPSADKVEMWKKDYQAMQGEMFFGESPSFDEILSTIQEFEDKFESGRKK